MMRENKRNKTSPIRLNIDQPTTHRSRSRSFYLVESKAYQPRFSKDAPTIVFTAGNEYDNLSPMHEKGVEGPRDSLTSWGTFRLNYKDFFSEFWVVFILILFGDGAVPQTLTSNGEKE
jgi:hypothetical protein